MKKMLLFTPVFLFLILNQFSLAQQNSGEPPVLPLKNSGSVLFGQDIVINNLPDQDQKNLAICSAPNGWLYAAYTFDSIGHAYYSIMRSEDNGLSWDFLVYKRPYLSKTSIKKLDIIAYGNSPSDQKVLIAWLMHYADAHMDYLSVHRYNAMPFLFDSAIFYIETISGHDMALACDNNYPALNATPNSIGILYSKTGTKDSIVFLSSGDGGITFNNRRVLAVTAKKFHKVALSYGRSASMNTGRYFAAWEEQNDTASLLGHIYTSHSNPDFNSPFTTPIKLDGLDTSLLNLCRNPVISCQANNADNDSTNLTEVILFEKFNTGTGDYDVCGFYNKKAASGNTFKGLKIAASINNELQPDIRFNPYDSTFMVTYYDSTAQKLPLLKKNMNIANPDTWEVVSPGYNDSNNLRYPNPKVNVNNGLNQAVTAWLTNQNTGKGSALFDAAYFPPIGIVEHDLTDIVKLVSVFPNPCNDLVTIAFELKNPSKVVITLSDLVGQRIGVIKNEDYPPGHYSVKYNVTGFQAGIYFCNITTGNDSASGKICVIR